MRKALEAQVIEFQSAEVRPSLRRELSVLVKFGIETLFGLELLSLKFVWLAVLHWTASNKAQHRFRCNGSLRIASVPSHCQPTNMCKPTTDSSATQNNQRTHCSCRSPQAAPCMAMVSLLHQPHHSDGCSERE